MLSSTAPALHHSTTSPLLDDFPQWSLDMDCRKSLWLGLGLLGVVGCWPQKTIPVAPASPQTPPAVELTKEKELPPLKPHASTCVALGDVHAQEANDASCPPLRQEALRDRARRAYQQALEIDPTNKEALLALARLYVANKDHDRAIATFAKATQAHPNSPEPWYALGIYQCQCKEWDPAVENLRKALACDPENRQYANALGYCLARSGHFEESLACFEHVVGPGRAHYNLARMLLHLQKDDLGRQHLMLALQADPQLSEAQQLLDQLDGKAPPSYPINDPAVQPTGAVQQGNSGQPIRLQ
jgi:Tfp pilus assembly protein PilF